MSVRSEYYAPIALLIMLILNAGCTQQQQFGDVSGTVKINNLPAAGIRVEFHPDPDSGTSGPSSYAETDANGNYRLTYHPLRGEEATFGTVVGTHRVIVLDLKASQSGGGTDSMAIRVPTPYMSLQSTPIIREVQTGTQSIDITIP